MEWRLLSLNYPDRSDYYQMMTACAVARSNAKTPQSIQPSNFRLNFGGAENISREERDKRALEVRDARIASRGGLGKYTIMDAQGNVIRPPTEPLRTPFDGCKNPLLRGPSAEEFNEFRERQRAAARANRPNDIRVRNPRSAVDGKGE